VLPVDLTWDAPAECPSYADVMTELERITRVKPDRVVTRITAQAQIERSSDGRYVLRLLTQREDQKGETDLEATTCAVLKRGVTLVLALTLGDGVELIDEKLAPLASASSPAARPPAVLPVSAPAAAPALRRAEGGARHPGRPTHAEPFRVTSWLAAAAAWGLLDKPSFAPRVGLSLAKSRWETRIDFGVWPPASPARVQGIASEFSALIGGLGACSRNPFGEWSLAACAVFELGAIRGSSLGAFRDGSAVAPWYAAGPALVLVAPLLGPVRLRLEASLLVAFDPPQFAIEYLRDVYRVSRFVPELSLGLALPLSSSRAQR
jgi:hypothetical protein